MHLAPLPLCRLLQRKHKKREKHLIFQLDASGVFPDGPMEVHALEPTNQRMREVEAGWHVPKKNLHITHMGGNDCYLQPLLNSVDRLGVLATKFAVDQARKSEQAARQKRLDDFKANWKGELGDIIEQYINPKMYFHG